MIQWEKAPKYSTSFVRNLDMCLSARWCRAVLSYTELSPGIWLLREINGIWAHIHLVYVFPTPVVTNYHKLRA